MRYSEQPRLREVQAREDYTLLLTYDNGEQKVYDAAPLLEFTAWKKLRNRGFFIHMSHVEAGTVAWDDMIDIAQSASMKTARH